MQGFFFYQSGKGFRVNASQIQNTKKRLVCVQKPTNDRTFLYLGVGKKGNNNLMLNSTLKK